MTSPMIPPMTPTTTLPYPELLTAVRRDGEAILAAAGQGLDVDVPTCGAWRMPDLLTHVGSVYRRVTIVVGERATTAVPWEPPGSDIADPVAYLTEALDELVQALSEADADTPVWNWSPQPQVAAFWARRMAHESAIHRYDAQRAHDVAQPLDADLARDGLDELVDVILPRVVERDQPSLPQATYSFVAAAEAGWHVRLDRDGVSRLETAKSADVEVRGTTSALLLAAYSRVPWTSLEVDGDSSLLDEWSNSISF
jgi:uncharacterized protein (TIGR03083 family)